jgi:hypothetical protein
MVWEFAVWGLEPRAITMIVSMPREANPCPWGFDQVQNLVLYMRELDIVTPNTIIGSIPRHLGQLRNLKTVLVPYMDFGGVIQLWGYNTNTVVQIQEGWKTRQAEFMRVLGQEGELQPPVVKFMVPQEIYVKFHLNYLSP